MDVTEETKIDRMTQLERIDRLISNRYYNDFDDNRKGKFLQYIINKKLENILIDDQLGWNSHYSQCIYVDFDLKHFPFPYWYPSILSNKDSDDDSGDGDSDDDKHENLEHVAGGDCNWSDDYKRKILFYILQFCYQFDSTPTDGFIKGKLLSLNQYSNIDMNKNDNYETFRRIDKLLYLFEKQLNRYDSNYGSTYMRYFNERNGNGKFLQLIIDQKLHTDKYPIIEQLGDGCTANNCVYTAIDLTPICTEYDTKEVIFRVIQYCYKYNKVPTVQDIIAILQSSDETETISIPLSNKYYCLCKKRLFKVDDMKLCEAARDIVRMIKQFCWINKFHLLCILPLCIYGGFEMIFYSTLRTSIINDNSLKFYTLGCWSFVSIISFIVIEKIYDCINRVYILTLMFIIHIIAWLLLFYYRDIIYDTQSDAMFTFLAFVFGIGTVCFMIQIAEILPMLIKVYQSVPCVACDFQLSHRNNPFWYCRQTKNEVHCFQTQFGILYHYFAICNNCVGRYAQITLNDHDEAVDIMDCHGDIIKCSYLDRLRNVIKKYEQNDTNIDEINIPQTLDDFMHLMNAHNDDKQFEYITNNLGNCDITKCSMFKRNYRDRSDPKNNEETTDILYNNIINIDKETIAYYQILERIHCHYKHCYDIGNRLLMVEQKQIVESKDDQENNFINDKVMRMQNILSNKRKMYQSIPSLNKRMNNRYNALFNSYDSSDSHLHIDRSKKFMFGVLFDYESDDIGTTHNVKPKYWSLKEEMVMNDIQTMNMDQFNSEYKKAEHHFNSHYRKKTWPRWRLKVISIQHILSLMIYCNFDGLSYEFSKTYRQCVDGKVNYYFQHTNFYHLGKYIKDAVHVFGTMIKYGNIKNFYHGMSRKLVLPTYVGTQLLIKCPLSTSSSYSVAANFAKHNQGLIIEFHEGISSSSNYFSMSWLSDFSNESEYLFIQNGAMEHLKVFNITDVATGTEFKLISDALTIIETITKSTYDEAVNDKFHLNVSEEMRVLIEKIIHHQLSYKLSQFEPFETIHEYAKQMINTYCKNKSTLKVTYPINKEISWFLALFHDDQQCIQLDLIHTLFPNLDSRFALNNVNLSDSLLYQILNLLRTKHKYWYRNKGFWINIVLNRDSELDVNALLSYKQQFESINFAITQRENDITIKRIENK